MGQFKPMVKMMTTEPSVELKLKKGGHVNFKKGGSAKKGEHGHKPMHHMMDGGVMGALASTPALVGRPAVNAPVAAPGKPSMAARRKAQLAKAAPAVMRKGGKAEGGETKGEHKAEMHEMHKIEKELKHHEAQKASKAHHGLKHGGKAKRHASGGEIDSFETKTTIEGNEGKFRNTEMHEAKADRKKGKTGDVKESNAGGYKRGGKVHHKATGGAIPDETTRGTPRTTMVHQAGKQSEKGPTGAVKEGNAGGYATGGVALSNAGGFKKGGKAKKAYATGGKVDSGHPVAMPQGRKKPTPPVAINMLSGTFKKGGKVTKAEGQLMREFDAENRANVRASKADSDERYSPFQKKMAKGGEVEDMSKGAYDRHYATEKAENEAMRESILGAPRRLMEGVKNLFTSSPPSGSVTKTEKSVTVTPGKKRGGRAC